VAKERNAAEWKHEYERLQRACGETPAIGKALVKRLDDERAKALRIHSADCARLLAAKGAAYQAWQAAQKIADAEEAAKAKPEPAPEPEPRKA
jgi:hypothetical protein